MATSVKNLIDQALRKFGAVQTGEQASPNEYADGLAALKIMLDGWSNEDLLVPFTVTERFPFDVGRYQYSIGIAGDWDTVRPEDIDFIRVEDAAGVKHPVYPVSRNRLQYQGTIEPGRPGRYTVSRDSRFLYVEFDVYPTDPFALVTSRKPFNAQALDNFDAAYDENADQSEIHPSGFTLTGIQTPLEFPTGYEGAILYNLAVHLAPEYPGIDLSPVVVSMAASSKALIKRANWQPLNMQAMDLPLRRGSYDIVSGP